MVLLRELVVDERARPTEPSRDGVGPLLPLEMDHLRQLRVDTREVLCLTKVTRRPGADTRYGGHVARAANRLLGGDGQRRERVLGRQRVVAFEQVVDGALERRTDSGRENRDEGHER